MNNNSYPSPIEQFGNQRVDDLSSKTSQNNKLHDDNSTDKYKKVANRCREVITRIMDITYLIV